LPAPDGVGGSATLNDPMKGPSWLDCDVAMGDVIAYDLGVWGCGGSGFRVQGVGPQQSQAKLIACDSEG